MRALTFDLSPAQTGSAVILSRFVIRANNPRDVYIETSGRKNHVEHTRARVCVWCKAAYMMVCTARSLRATGIARGSKSDFQRCREDLHRRESLNGRVAGDPYTFSWVCGGYLARVLYELDLEKLCEIDNFERKFFPPSRVRELWIYRGENRAIYLFESRAAI